MCVCTTAFSSTNHPRILQERQSREAGGRPQPPYQQQQQQQQQFSHPQRSGMFSTEADGGAQQTQPFPFEPDQADASTLFKPGIEVSLLMTIAPQNPIIASGL